MPFYEYECGACKFYVEALQKISDPPLRQCPSCRKQALKRLISAPVFRLKGGGWYETDFKSEKEEKRNLAEREEAAAPEQAPKDAGAEAGKDAKAPAAGKEAAKPAEKPADKATPAAKRSKAPSKKPPAKPAKPAKAKAKARRPPGKTRRR